MESSEASQLMANVASFALATIALSVVAALVIMSIEEVFLRGYIQRAIVRNWLVTARHKVRDDVGYHYEYKGLVNSTFGKLGQAIALLTSAYAGYEEGRLLHLTGPSLYALPQRQMSAQVLSALQLDWINGEAGPLISTFQDKYGEPPPPRTGTAEPDRPGRTLLVAERAVDALQAQVSRTWNLFRYFSSFFLIAVLILISVGADEFSFTEKWALVGGVVIVAAFETPLIQIVLDRIRSQAT